jgi:cyclopropane fatty-acyl-phospholipid synthase-like methyltransferase
MTKSEMDEQVRIVCRMRRLSRHTENTYAGWIARFGAHVKSCAHLTREERVRTYLEKLAPRCSASTQNQALKFASSITSPLDVLPQAPNVVPFRRAA